MKMFYCFSGNDLWSFDAVYRPLSENEFSENFGSRYLVPFPSETGESYLVDLDEGKEKLPVAGYLHDMRSLLMNSESRTAIQKSCCAARGYLRWYRTNKFCGRCGGRTEFDFSEKAALCRTCGESVYPRVAPCVIMLIHDNGKILLANNVKYRIRNLYSILAGYVDPGENLEEAVHREIKEEAGIEVDQLEYIKSQSWPFPNQLMLAFKAKYKSGVLDLQEEELAHADWYDAEHLPDIPGPGSVAGQLIREYFKLD